MAEKIEIYEGELILACHQTIQRVAEKAGLKYDQPFSLTSMVELMKKTITANNPNREIVFISKPAPASKVEHNLKRVEGWKRLLRCETCGGSEMSLTMECPGRMMTREEFTEVQQQRADFSNGQWIGTLSADKK